MRPHRHINPVLVLKYMLSEWCQASKSWNLNEKDFWNQDGKFLCTWLNGYWWRLGNLRGVWCAWTCCLPLTCYVISWNKLKKTCSGWLLPKIKVLLLWASGTNGNYAWKLTAALPLLFSPSPPPSGLWAAGTTGRDSASQQAAESQMSGVLTKGNTPAPVI